MSASGEIAAPGGMADRPTGVPIIIRAPGVAMLMPALIVDAGEDAARFTLEFFLARDSEPEHPRCLWPRRRALLPLVRGSWRDVQGRDLVAGRRLSRKFAAGRSRRPEREAPLFQSAPPWGGTLTGEALDRRNA
jgi:hypothetical protein